MKFLPVRRASLGAVLSALLAVCVFLFVSTPARGGNGHSPHPTTTTTTSTVPTTTTTTTATTTTSTVPATTTTSSTTVPATTTTTSSSGGACTGISVPAGADIQGYINSSPGGTTFCLAAGVYHPSGLNPASGDVFWGSDSWQSVLDGANTAQYAFSSSTAANVQIHDLVIQNYNTPLQQGAIQSFGTSGWVIDGNHITHNAAAGVAVDGAAQVTNNLIDYNTEEGYACHGNGDYFYNNEIAYNNLNLSVSWSWEAGGGKCFQTSNTVFSYNYSHNNGGPGFWTDTQNTNTTYDHNRAIDNYAPGIMHEVSNSATITNNDVEGNGFGDNGGWVWDSGILISTSGGQDSSHPITIQNNTVVLNYNGITIADQCHRSDKPPQGVRNIHVDGNTITMHQGVTGAATDCHDNTLFADNVSFQGNSYVVSNVTGTYWAWNNVTLTWTAWLGYGQDTTGTLGAG